MKIKLFFAGLLGLLFILMLTELNRTTESSPQRPAPGSDGALFSMRVEARADQEQLRLTELHGFAFMGEIDAGPVRFSTVVVSVPRFQWHLITDRQIHNNALERLTESERDSLVSEADFAFLMQYDTEKLSFVSLKGTAWESLGFNCSLPFGISCDARVTDTGIGRHPD